MVAMATPAPEPEPEPEPSGLSIMGPLFMGWPARLVASPSFGRGVVASRAIRAGERVLASAPLGVAIDRRHMPTRCSLCFATRETRTCIGGGSDSSGEEDGELEHPLSCERCHSVFYCSASCQLQASEQHALECEALRAVDCEKRLKKEERALARLLISAIATLAAGSDGGGVAPCTLPQLLQLFPDQPQSVGFRKRAKQRKVAAEALVRLGGQTLLNSCVAAGGQDFRDVALLMSMLSRGPMNEFGLYCVSDDDGDHGSSTAGTAYYPAAAMLNHSCVPNVAHQFEGRCLVFYALHDIDVGAPLCFAYVSPTAATNTAERQTILRASWCFTCVCERCCLRTLPTSAYEAAAAGVNGDATAAMVLAQLAAYDAQHLCICGQLRLPLSRCRPHSNPTPLLKAQAERPVLAPVPEVARLLQRWAVRDGATSVEAVCRCNVYNLIVDQSDEE